MTQRRGEIWLVDFGEPVGHEHAGIRPAVIVSTDDLNEGPSGIVIVVPMTASRRDLPSHIEVDVGESGLDYPSYAKCEDVRSISDRRLVNLIGVADPRSMFDIGRVLRHLFDL